MEVKKLKPCTDIVIKGEFCHMRCSRWNPRMLGGLELDALKIHRWRNL